MDKLPMIYEWLKLHWTEIAFCFVFLVEQVLPKWQKVEAHSITELIPELLQMLVKLVKKDYTQPEKKD